MEADERFNNDEIMDDDDDDGVLGVSPVPVSMADDDEDDAMEESAPGAPSPASGLGEGPSPASQRPPPPPEDETPLSGNIAVVLDAQYLRSEFVIPSDASFDRFEAALARRCAVAPCAR